MGSTLLKISTTPMVRWRGKQSVSISKLSAHTEYFHRHVITVHIKLLRLKCQIIKSLLGKGAFSLLWLSGYGLFPRRSDMRGSIILMPYSTNVFLLLVAYQVWLPLYWNVCFSSPHRKEMLTRNRGPEKENMASPPEMIKRTLKNDKSIPLV